MGKIKVGVVLFLFSFFISVASANATPYYTANQADFVNWSNDASYASSFGLYYVGDTTKKLEVFAFNSDPSHTEKSFSVADWAYLNKGFGFYFAVHTGGKSDMTEDYFWFSDPLLNQYANGNPVDTNVQHVLVESIGTHFLNIALDDQLGGGDRDFNDKIIYGMSCRFDEKIPAPVPEPATTLLFGTGLVGLAGLARRKK